MKKTFILSAIFVYSVGVNAQDIHFSQFWMSPMLLNPAQAGAETPVRAIINHKNQWNSVASTYKTSDVAVDFNFSKDNSKGYSGFAVSVFHDKAGEIKTFMANGSYAYHVILSEKSQLGGGFYLGYGQKSIDFSNLQWMNQYDGTNYNSSLPSGEQAGINSFAQLDMGAGLHFAHGEGERYMTGNDNLSYNGGIAFSHLNRPSNSFFKSDEKLDMKTTAYANALIGLGNSNLSFVPGLLFSKQGKMNEILFGGLLKYALKDQSKYTGFVKASAFSLGAHYRNNDAVIVSGLFEMDKYAIGFSYDLNVSGLKSATSGRGGLEVALRFLNFGSTAAPKASHGNTRFN